MTPCCASVRLPTPNRQRVRMTDGLSQVHVVGRLLLRGRAQTWRSSLDLTGLLAGRSVCSRSTDSVYTSSLITSTRTGSSSVPSRRVPILVHSSVRALFCRPLRGCADLRTYPRALVCVCVVLSSPPRVYGAFAYPLCA